MKNSKNPSEEIDGILSDTSNNDFDFEERVVNSDVIQIITRLMQSEGRNWSKAKLAEELHVSKAYISKLFSGDKKVNVNLIARIQRIFNTRIRIVTSDLVMPMPANELLGQILQNGHSISPKSPIKKPAPKKEKV